VRRAFPYHTLSRKDFVSLLEYLSGSYVGLESRRVYGKIWYDEKDGVFGRRGRYTKLIYYLNIGTIPDEVAIEVYTLDRKWIGSIEEGFLARLKPGDIFVLGGRLYRFDHSREMRCFVSRADAKFPTIPPWFSEQLPLTYELALEIGQFRKELALAMSKEVMRKKSVIDELRKNRIKMRGEAAEILDEMPIDANTKNSIFSYFAEQMLFAKHIPNDKLMLIEKTKDEKRERNFVIFHSLYGRRVNDALSRAFAIEMGEMFETDVGIMINDNGFVIVTGAELRITKSDISNLVSKVVNSDITAIIKSNVRRTEMMKRRFRHCAARGFMILRNYKGKRISVRRQQMNSEALLSATEEISSDFPILKETYREIMEDVMDLPRAKEIMEKIRNGEIDYEIIETPLPSPFSHVMITFGEADIIMMKDRRKHLRELHKHVLEQIRKGYS
jgi:ATP-dependent Lhr-like helicase